VKRKPSTRSDGSKALILKDFTGQINSLQDAYIKFMTSQFMTSQGLLDNKKNSSP
jgi:hypothetical protein